MREVVIIYAMLAAAAIVFVAMSWVFARLVGARVTGIAIGMPPSVRLRAGEPVVRIGPIPSGFIELHGRAPGSDDGDPRSWKRLGLARRLLVVLGPWLVTFALAVGCLGPARARRSFAHAFEQLLFTVDVTPLMRHFLDVVTTAPIAITFGVVLAKLVAVNLLPLGGTAGGGTIQELLSSREPSWLRTVLAVMGLLVMLWIAARFGWAIVRLV